MKALNNKNTTSTMFMAIQKIAKQGLTHPFGDHRTVKQAFPAGIPSVESDPFLMCDYFDMTETQGPAQDEDDFPVGWHPHRGFDIASYLKSGTGRHGDSLGNRETFETPGMQWMSTGSGVEHGEGGATEKGVFVQGFQIWVNVPASRKMDDPRYGTVPTKDLPLVPIGEASKARVLAGKFQDGDSVINGPFETVQPVQMIDLEVGPNESVHFDVQSGLDTAMLYVYEGALASVNDQEASDVEAGTVLLMDATSPERRGLELRASADGKAGVMLFAGKKLKEPIAWRGPIVMNTDEQIYDTFMELRMGDFPPKRVPWDYKRANARPSQEEQKEL
jgi:redox-sensitive bicupin YhaK (pirin superfamily)